MKKNIKRSIGIPNGHFSVHKKEYELEGPYDVNEELRKKTVSGMNNFKDRLLADLCYLDMDVVWVVYWAISLRGMKKLKFRKQDMYENKGRFGFYGSML